MVGYYETSFILSLLKLHRLKHPKEDTLLSCYYFAVYKCDAENTPPRILKLCRIKTFDQKK